MKDESKDFALFTLSMPNVGSWNGKWSAEGELYTKSVRFISRGKNLYPNLKERGYFYDFGDGWGANVKVSFVMRKEAVAMQRKSKGFCGYEWMIDSILKNDKIKCD